MCKILTKLNTLSTVELLEEARVRLSQIAARLLLNEFEIAWWITFAEKVACRYDDLDTLEEAYTILEYVGLFTKQVLIRDLEERDEIVNRIKTEIFPTEEKKRNYRVFVTWVEEEFEIDEAD